MTDCFSHALSKDFFAVWAAPSATAETTSVRTHIACVGADFLIVALLERRRRGDWRPSARRALVSRDQIDGRMIAVSQVSVHGPCASRHHRLPMPARNALG